MEQLGQSNGRYGIDIQGQSAHAETDSLIEILAVLKGQAGHVYIIDRETNACAFEGNVADVRKSLMQRLAGCRI